MSQIDYLISHSKDLELPNIYGETLLAKAAELGDAVVIRELLLAGVSPDSRFGAFSLY
jgi:hypothetical protein